MRRANSRARISEETEFRYGRDIVAEESVQSSLGRTPAIAVGIVAALLVLAGLAAWNGVRGSSLPLRGTVVRKSYVPPHTIAYHDGYGTQLRTTPERHTIDLRPGGTNAVENHDVPKTFWERAEPDDRVRRENGEWHVDGQALPKG